MAKDLISYYRTEEFTGLAEEIAVAFKEYASNERDNRLRFKFLIARAILDSPAYRKWGKENGDFMTRLANRIKQELKNKELPALSRSSLYDAVQVFSVFPTLEALEKKIGVWGNWQAALALIGRNQESKSLDFGISDLRKCSDCELCQKHALKI